MKPFKWIWPYIRKYRWQYVVGLICSTITVGLGLLNPYVGGLIAKEVFQDNNLGALPTLLLVMIVATLAKTGIRYFFTVMFEQCGQSIIFDIRRDIYDRIQKQSFAFFDSNRVGDIMSRMTGDLDAIRHFSCYVIYALYENILTFFVAIGLMFAISWKLTLIMLTVAPFIAYYTFKQSKEIKPAFSIIREQFSKLNSVCQENISGNRIVKAFTQEDYEIEKFTKENQAYYQTNVDASNVWVRFFPIQEFIAGFLGIFMILFGGIMVINGSIELYQLIIINGYLWAVNNPMRMLGWLVNDTQRFVASLDKIYGMMRTKIDIKNLKDAKTTVRVKGDIEFKNVSFSYDKFRRKTLALKNVSFQAKAGYTVGIVGPTGSGKTTLVNLLSRFYDVTDGAILVDGVDVKDYNLQSLRKDISYAMQDVFLFSDTIEGNLAYGVPDAPMEDLVKAAVAADADTFIKKTSEGYDTIVGERGVGLSGGQKQRLSLARALATKPSIMILDDTTSAVDMETEHSIQKALEEQYSDSTTFIIAHRISSVRSADLILVLLDGAVIESGTHEQLVKKHGYYYELFINQYGDFETMLGQGGDKDGKK